MSIIFYGQENVPGNNSVDNPACSNVGVLNAGSLPFTVPSGKKAVVKSYGIEGYDFAGISVIFPWIGTSSPANNQCLHSCAADSGSNEVLGGEWEVDEGETLNIRLQNGTANTAVFGWYCKIEVVDK